MTESQTVAIVGAGPAGLVLARILSINKGYKVVVYEAEQDQNQRGQGGYLDLHKGTGQRALKEANLYKQFTTLVHDAMDGHEILDSDGNLLYSDTGDGSRPEIERTDLRNLLIQSIDKQIIRWGCKLTGIEKPIDSGRIGMVFADGTKQYADIVVGADGAWSRVRPVLTNVKPTYTGVTMLDSLLPPGSDVSGLKYGSLWAADNKGNFLFGHIGVSSRIYLARKCHPDEMLETQGPIFLQGWNKNLYKLGTYPSTKRQIYALPIDTRWTRDEAWKSNVTIIGDAAHVMSPFAGEGANLALADGADLARALLNAYKFKTPVGKAIELFEKKYMWSRARRAAKESQANLEKFFSAENAHGLAKMMRDMMSWSNLAYMVWDWLLYNISWVLGFY
ncbi:hypothetical protein HDV06_001256 [Boothiomyces sp. JEL0866]|nr:hypothetical protein HDV06_001256 [Boothiomyces sp. JEL0866]